MSRFRIDHPYDPELHAYAGDDRFLGFFVSIHRGERREKPIKFLDLFTHGESVGLIDALDFLASNGFFAHEDLEDALRFIERDDERYGSEAARRIVGIIGEFAAKDPRQ